MSTSEETEQVKEQGSQDVTPISPVPTLVEEVELKIIKTLDNNQSKLSCFRTCPTWKQWLRKERTIFLFAEVAPLILEGLPKKDLLECRKACQSWKEGLDRAHQAHPQHLELDFKYDTHQLPLTIGFHAAENIQQFLQEMDSHPGNPFPGRQILLGWECPEHTSNREQRRLFRKYWNSVPQLLTPFGHHVHFASICFYDFELFDNKLNLERTLRSCLSGMPNLKKLEIGAFTCSISKRMEAAFRRNELPQLINLESFKCDDVFGLTHNLVNSVLESCCLPHKIKTLDLSGSSNGKRLEEPVYRFTHLEKLGAKLGVEDLERFGNLEIPPPPLKELCVRLTNQKPEGMDFQRIFMALELFADSLEDVTVLTYMSRLPLEFFNNNANRFKINLPKLKRLMLEDYHGPLDPFIQLQSLRYLEIEFDGLRQWEGSVVDLDGFEERMERSNIWDLIPSLETLIISGMKNSILFYKKYHRSTLGLNTGENGENH